MCENTKNPFINTMNPKITRFLPKINSEFINQIFLANAIFKCQELEQPDDSPSNTTPATNTPSNTMTTPSNTAIDTAEALRLTATINGIFSNKLPAILTGMHAILKEVRVCVIRNDEDRLKQN